MITNDITRLIDVPVGDQFLRGPSPCVCVCVCECVYSSFTFSHSRLSAFSMCYQFQAEHRYQLRTHSKPIQNRSIETNLNHFIEFQKKKNSILIVEFNPIFPD